MLLPRGVFRIEIEALDSPSGVKVFFGDEEAEVVGASTSHITARAPIQVASKLRVIAGKEEATAAVSVGNILADELNPVTSPALDSSGNVYVTYSGGRGESVPFSVYRISPQGQKEPFLSDIVNATGIVIGPDDHIYVSSRHEGTIYRSTPDRQVANFAEGLGLATGLVFDKDGHLYVGDRSGFIYRIDSEGDATLLCELEPSVSAYHLALGPNGSLFVTGPTLATQDVIYEISPDGQVQQYFRGFGRPQGLAFSPHGVLEVAASYRGLKGVFSVSKEGEVRQTLAGPMLVGMVYDEVRSVLYLVDNDSLYSVPLSPEQES